MCVITILCPFFYFYFLFEIFSYLFESRVFLFQINFRNLFVDNGIVSDLVNMLALYRCFGWVLYIYISILIKSYTYMYNIYSTKCM